MRGGTVCLNARISAPPPNYREQLAKPWRTGRLIPDNQTYIRDARRLARDPGKVASGTRILELRRVQAAYPEARLVLSVECSSHRAISVTRPIVYDRIAFFGGGFPTRVREVTCEGPPYSIGVLGTSNI